MSDEMVQEKAEEAAAAAPENGHAVRSSGDESHADPLSSPVGASAAATAEPAPARPATESVAPEMPAPPVAAEPAAPLAAPPTPVVAEAFASSPEAAGADQEQYDLGSQYDRSLRPLQEGDVITGTVMRVDREGVLVDVGAKSEGIIKPNELSRDAAANVNPESIVKVGEQIRVYVLEPENQDGNPILSKKRADFEQAWERVQQSKESGETLSAMVTDRVKGGLVVDLGIRGFVPASHVGSGSLKNNLDKYVGQAILLKVIEVDKERRKVVLSNKLAVAEEREQRSAQTKASLAPNQQRRGVVRRLTNYGAFVDLGGIDGLLHISEMSWTRINDPKEVLREGQEIDVLILKMDLENNRVSLGLRQILPDPWTEIASLYKEGDVITGTVTRIVPFGAFVQVAGGVEGIIPNSELPRRGGKGGSGVSPNEEVTIKVIGLRPVERKMTLSMRALAPVEEQQGPVNEPAGAPAGGREGRRERRGARGDRDETDDFARYAPGRQEEPRSTLADAFAAAKRKDRTRRERYQEEDVDLSDIDIESDADPGGVVGATDPTGPTESVEVVEVTAEVTEVTEAAKTAPKTAPEEHHEGA